MFILSRYNCLSRQHVNFLISMYQPLEVTKREKCGKVLAESEELDLVLVYAIEWRYKYTDQSFT